MNVSTVRVDTWWDTVLKVTRTVSGVATGVFVLAWLAFSLMPEKKKEEE